MSPTATDVPTHLLFDLGGVIVELRGRPIRDEWLGDERSGEAVWETWLTSNAPREFEAGRTEPDEFARAIVEELDLDVEPGVFLEHFLRFPIGPFPGALELLHGLKGRYRTALFSNSNKLHWVRKMGEMHLDDAFHEHFASHLIGYVKPDPQAFEHVIRNWNAESPGRILFLDDNRLNVEAARAAGMRAERVVGLEAAREVLARHGVEL